MDKTIMKIIVGAITIILAAALIVVLATETNYKTEKVLSSSEPIGYSALRLPGGTINTTYWLHVSYTCPKSNWRGELGSECLLSSHTLTNGTIALVADTDYVLNTTCDSTTGAGNGDFRLLNTVTTNNSKYNTTYVSYNYCSNDYMASGFGKTGLDLIIGFIAVLALGMVVALLYSVYKDYNL